MNAAPATCKVDHQQVASTIARRAPANAQQCNQDMYVCSLRQQRGKGPYWASWAASASWQGLLHAKKVGTLCCDKALGHIKFCIDHDFYFTFTIFNTG